MTATIIVGGDPNKVNIAGYSKGAILAANAAGGLVAVPVGSANNVLATNAAATTGVNWSGTPAVTDLALPITTTPAPVAGTSLIYSVDNNGLTILKLMTPEGVELSVTRDHVMTVRNQSGVTITKGTAVYVSDVFTGSGIVPVVSPAQSNVLTTMPVIGIVMADILNNSFGRVMTSGRLDNLNTVAFPVGATLYVSSTNAGQLVSARPAHPNLTQWVALVLRSHATLGALFIWPGDVDGEDAGTISPTWGVGDNTAGTKSVVFKNGNSLTLQATPTAARTVTVPDATGTLALTSQLIGLFPFSKAGTLTTFVGAARLYNDTGRTLTISAVRASVGTAPTGTSLIVDVKKNGITIFTTQANRPTIAIGANTSGKVTNMDITSLADGDYLTVDVAQVGSTVAGADLTVTVYAS